MRCDECGATDRVVHANVNVCNDSNYTKVWNTNTCFVCIDALEAAGYTLDFDGDVSIEPDSVDQLWNMERLVCEGIENARIHHSRHPNVGIHRAIHHHWNRIVVLFARSLFNSGGIMPDFRPKFIYAVYYSNIEVGPARFIANMKAASSHEARKAVAAQFNYDPLDLMARRVG
jgi:hypothetical protein